MSLQDRFKRLHDLQGALHTEVTTMYETLSAAKSEISWTKENEHTWQSVRSNTSANAKAVVVQVEAKTIMIAELENGLSLLDEKLRSILTPSPPTEIDVPMTTMATMGHHVSNYEKGGVLRHVLSSYVHLVDGRPVATYQTFQFGPFTILGTQLVALWHAVHGLEYVCSERGHDENYARDYEVVPSVASLIPVRRPRDANSTLVNAITSVYTELKKRVHPQSTFYANNELKAAKERLRRDVTAADIASADREHVRFVELGNQNRGLYRIYNDVWKDVASICSSFDTMSVLQTRSSVRGILVSNAFHGTDCPGHLLSYFRDLAEVVGLRRPYGVLLDRLGRDGSVLYATYREAINNICVSHGVIMDPFDVGRLHRVICARIFEIPGFDVNFGEIPGVSQGPMIPGAGLSRDRVVQQAVYAPAPPTLSPDQHGALESALRNPDVMALKEDGIVRILKQSGELPCVGCDLDLSLLSLPTLSDLWEYVLGSGAEPAPMCSDSDNDSGF